MKKWGFYFLFSSWKHMLWYSLETAPINEAIPTRTKTQVMFSWRIKQNIFLDTLLPRTLNVIVMKGSCQWGVFGVILGYIYIYFFFCKILMRSMSARCLKWVMYPQLVFLWRNWENNPRIIKYFSATVLWILYDSAYTGFIFLKNRHFLSKNGLINWYMYKCIYSIDTTIKCGI